MTPEDEKRVAAKLSRIMVMLCVRNTQLETLHSGPAPVTRVGDYSDVFVVDADGRRIAWTEVSHINEDEMRELMREIVNRLYTFHLCADDPKLQAQIERWMGVAGKWDEPEIDQRMISRGEKQHGDTESATRGRHLPLRRNAAFSRSMPAPRRVREDGSF